MQYNKLLQEACSFVPGFKKEYDKQVSDGMLDEFSGMHTVFSFVFMPLLIDSLNEKNDNAKKMFDFIEKMALSEDKEVSEVVDFTILEELCDNFNDADIISFMGEETAMAQKNIRRYILGPANN